MNTVTTLIRNGIRIIRINKPNKKNAVAAVEFDAITDIIGNDINDDRTKLTVLTGSNDYFTSGLDMNVISKYIIEKDDSYADKTPLSLRNMIEQIVDYPKLLIAVVNGPAVGIGTTILPFCDYVYASEHAFFQCPFVKMGLHAEACSSLLFPILMNRMVTFDLIFLGKRIDVQTAKDLGLVGQIYRDEDINKVYEDIEDIAKLPFEIVKLNKKIIMENFRETLLQCNKHETEMLKTVMRSSQFLNAVNMFLTRKNRS